MKLEEVNTRTKEAVDFLVAALESGHSEVLTAYLGAMAKFHTYSFGNPFACESGSQRAESCMEEAGIYGGSDAAAKRLGELEWGMAHFDANDCRLGSR
jgi:hypothetical protein